MTVLLRYAFLTPLKGEVPGLRSGRVTVAIEGAGKGLKILPGLGAALGSGDMRCSPGREEAGSGGTGPGAGGQGSRERHEGQVDGGERAVSGAEWKRTWDPYLESPGLPSVAAKSFVGFGVRQVPRSTGSKNPWSENSRRRWSAHSGECCLQQQQQKDIGARLVVVQGCHGFLQAEAQVSEQFM